MAPSSIGRSRKRREDLRFIRGEATFTSDISMAGMLHAAFVRSTEAHGTILGIDTSGADTFAGVVATYTGSRLGALQVPPPAGIDNPAFLLPVLAEGKVRFVGEPIVMVVGVTPESALDGAEHVAVDIEPQPAVTKAHEAAQGGVLLFETAGSNVVVERSVGVPGGGSGAPVEASVVVKSQRLDPVAMETYAAVAVPESDGTSTLWCGSGTPLGTRDGIAAALGLTHDELRVRVQDVGGGFGQRSGFHQEQVAIIAASRALGKPVKWVAGRREQFVIGEHGRDLLHEITIRAGADGVIRGADISILANLGAYPQRGWFIPLTALQLASGPYSIPELFVTAKAVVTNTAPTGPYRGAGRPEAGLAIEQAMDALAEVTGLAPGEVRRRNFVQPAAMPYTTLTGLTHDSGDYAALADRTAELLERRARLHRERALPSRRIGIGMASFVETTAGQHVLGEYGRVEVTAGGVDAYTASMSSGQGHETVWPQVIADALGVDEAAVTVIAGDTDRIPHGIGTFGSRSAVLGATAIALASKVVREKVLGLAADILEADEGDLSIASGRVGVKGAPGSSLPFSDIVTAAERKGVSLSAETTFVADHQPLASGCYGAVVSLDIETGSFDLVEFVAVDDCGVQLNPMIVVGQVHGGLGQGLGQAMFEQVVYDEGGQPLTTTFMDYSIPAAGSLPFFTTSHMATPSSANLLGVKGVGEAGTIGAPPAVVAAVRAALDIPVVSAAPLRLPLLPETVWRASAPPSDATRPA
jgi:carbon-monoxide dehydrogenase large subunit